MLDFKGRFNFTFSVFVKYADIISGFSRKTAEAFWLGFPSDWQQLIYEHFRTAPINRFIE
jgi:hypothetical protein